MTIPFPNGALEAFAEIAFGADINGDQALWTWTDITPTGVGNVLMSQDITTTRGRQDEASHVSPTQSALELDNETGDFTPDDATSVYYPNVIVGTPARWGIEASHPRLLINPFDEARVQVTSTPALNLTSDLDVRVDMQAKTTDPATNNTIIVGRASDTGAYSWRLQFLPDRRVEIKWSTDGTTAALVSVISDVDVLPSNARTVLRVTVDVNNGAGGHEVKFYLGESMTGPWTQVGSTFTGTGVTTIFNAAQDLVLGHPPDSTLIHTIDADVYEMWLLDGIDGPALANPDFTILPENTTTFNDAAGRTWNVFAGAEINSRWCRIVGTIDSWAPTWPYGDLSSQQDGGIDLGEARVDITISGILRRLGQGALSLNSALRRSIEDESSVVAYWGMEDEKDSTQFASALPEGGPMLVGSGVTFADSSTLIGSQPLPKLAPAASFSGAVAGVFAGAWQVDWYVNVPLENLAGDNVIMRINGTGTVRLWEIKLSSTSWDIKGYSPSGSLVTSTLATPFDFFDRWVHVHLEARQSGANVVWSLHWQEVTYPSSFGWTTSPETFAGTVGGISSVGVPPRAGIPEMHMGHLAVFAHTSFDPVANAAMGWTGETAMTRMRRLCTEENVPFRVIGADADTVLVGPQRVTTLLNLLNDAADADGGILYEQNCAVGLIYRTRTSLYNQPPNMVLDGLQKQYGNPLTPVLDDQKLRNRVTVTRTGGSSSTVTDQASIDAHGLYEESVTLNLFLDSQTQDAAAWRLHQGTVKGMRYPSMTTNLGVAPEIIDPWLGVDIGGKVDLINLPPQHPAVTVDLMVEGYSEPISETTWQPTANCSPGQVWTVAEIEGDSPGLGVDDQYLLRLETDGSVLAVPISSTDTQLFVTVTDGPPWVTGAAEFPFDIFVGGEQVTVTGIGAPTGGTEFVNAGSAEPTTASSSFVAPSVNAVASGDLLIAAWQSTATTGTYTLPGGMTIGALTSGVSSSLEDATEVLGAAGPTGNRTATFSGSDTWSAVMTSVHGASGTPVIAQYSSDMVSGGPVTFSVPATAGDWLLVIQGWEWDPGANMGPPSGGGWALINVSSPDPALTNSRITVWAKRVLATGQYSTTLSVTPSGVADNHGRIYVLSGVSGVTQQFSVIRSINGIVKSHPVFTDVHLWEQPVLAR